MGWGPVTTFEGTVVVNEHRSTEFQKFFAVKLDEPITVDGPDGNLASDLVGFDAAIDDLQELVGQRVSITGPVASQEVGGLGLEPLRNELRVTVTRDDAETLLGRPIHSQFF